MNGENESFMQQKINPNPVETILKIHRISDLPKIVGFRQHSDSDSNSDTSLLYGTDDVVAR